MVGDPAEQRTRDSVHHAVEHQCQRQGGHHEEVQVDLEVLDTEVLGDDAQLCHGHHAAGDHQHEHHQHQPEQPGAKRFLQRVVARGLRQLVRCLDLGCLRRAQEPGGRERQRALQHPEEQEGVLEARGLDHRRDRQDRGGRAGAVTARGQADRETAAVREPLDRVVDAGRVDRTDAKPADRGADVEAHQRGGLRVDDPRTTHQQGAEGDHHPRPELVDEIALDRRQPGLHQHEHREGDLDIGARPAEGFLDFRDEQRPGVLDVGGGDHADDANDQLCPARLFGDLWIGAECRRRRIIHGALLQSFDPACPNVRCRTSAGISSLAFQCLLYRWLLCPLHIRS